MTKLPFKRPMRCVIGGGACLNCTVLILDEENHANKIEIDKEINTTLAVGKGTCTGVGTGPGAGIAIASALDKAVDCGFSCRYWFRGIDNKVEKAKAIGKLMEIEIA